jgi:molybdopterin molybdotransferase
MPAFDCAAMDGYAVGSAAGPWRLVGQALAGHGVPNPVAAGEAVEIATGAPTPAGAVAVLPHEQATGARPPAATGARTTGWCSGRTGMPRSA